MRLAEPFRSSTAYDTPTVDARCPGEAVVGWQGRQILCYRLSTGALVPMNPLPYDEEEEA